MPDSTAATRRSIQRCKPTLVSLTITSIFDHASGRCGRSRPQLDTWAGDSCRFSIDPLIVRGQWPRHRWLASAATAGDASASWSVSQVVSRPFHTYRNESSLKFEN